ncbi:MAG: twin-arginine translocase TatA/TatE family subunit [Euryarchaeota archaeon]|nr:twin-arginine translocase TatA/TatE family subunit [Euryarchaeota archaeon]
MISPYLALFGVGGMELLLVIVVFIAFFGVERIPEAARAVGRLQAQVKTEMEKYKSEAQRAADHDVYRDAHAKAATTAGYELRRAAVELGIGIQGKTDDALRAEIREKMG